jgi:hypothetical protein
MTQINFATRSERDLPPTRGTAGTIVLSVFAFFAAAVAAIPVYAQTSAMPPGVSAPGPQLTPGQRSAIFSAVSKDDAKATPSLAFNPVIGNKVPPSIALFALPANTLVDIPAVRSYEYTFVKNQVVLVDPTTMEVVDIIRP